MFLSSPPDLPKRLFTRENKQNHTRNVIGASHLSGSNGVDCDLYGTNHIVDFMALQGLSHYDNTSTIPGATLEKRQKAVNKEYHDRTRKLDSELHGSQQDQRGPIESELNEYGHRGRVFAPVIGRYGGASSDLSLILDLVAREMARKHTAFYNIGFSEAIALFRQACTQMGSRNCSGMGDSSSGSPERFRCSPLLCERKLLF